VAAFPCCASKLCGVHHDELTAVLHASLVFFSLVLFYKVYTAVFCADGISGCF
jgi:hypothetical protein